MTHPENWHLVVMQKWPRNLSAKYRTDTRSLGITKDKRRKAVNLSKRTITLLSHSLNAII